MATIDRMMMEYSEYIDNAVAIKALVLERLQKDGVISDDQLKEYHEDWQVLIIKKGWFKQLFSKDDSSDYIFRLVKINNQ